MHFFVVVGMGAFPEKVNRCGYPVIMRGDAGCHFVLPIRVFLCGRIGIFMYVTRNLHKGWNLDAPTFTSNRVFGPYLTYCESRECLSDVSESDKCLCFNYVGVCDSLDRLCGLVVRVSGYRYRVPGFDSRRYQIFSVVGGLERGPLSLVRSIEELLE